MTIAACHVCPEGVVLGTDSTTTVTSASGSHYLDYEQKIFEVGGQGSSIAIATWGQGRIGGTSHRTIAAKLGEFVKNEGPSDLQAVADELSRTLWEAMWTGYGEDLDRALNLRKRLTDEGAEELTEHDWEFLLRADQVLSGGYFLAGRTSSCGDCSAYSIEWSIRQDMPLVSQLPNESPIFRGVPQMMERLVLGYDQGAVERLLKSGKWSGTEAELYATLNEGALIMPTLLPIREAIDWIHTVIHTTIRAVKFGGWHVCGGPIEVAVVTTDRPFRWVCHKPLDAAIITAQEGRRS